MPSQDDGAVSPWAVVAANDAAVVGVGIDVHVSVVGLIVVGS